MTVTRIKADLCVIGAGSAGLTVASGAAQLGRKVVLFEKGEMGGDCLNYGCVPSKALLTAAHHAHAVRTGARMGVCTSEPEIDFAKVRAHIQRAIDAIHPNDSQERFEALGVTVIREHASFVDERTVRSETHEVVAKRFVLATGTRARIPPIDGLDRVDYLTNANIWDLETRPDHLVILGGGPIGCELGQAFRRLGADVTIIEADRLLGRMDADHAGRVREALINDGVELVEGSKAARVDGTATDVSVTLDDGRRVTGSHLLVAIGREPVFDGLGLEAAGIETDEAGLVCDDKLKTGNPRVFAAGDIAGKGALTHLAGWHGSVIVRNLYFGLPTRQSSAAIPAAVYTDPPLAQIGLTEADARERHGDDISVASAAFDDNDRAVAEGLETGGVKLILGKGGKVLGASIVGERADDLLQIVSLTVHKGGKVRDLTEAIAPYPTRGEIWKRAANAHFQPVVFGRWAKMWAGLLSRFH